MAKKRRSTGAVLSDDDGNFEERALRSSRNLTPKERYIRSSWGVRLGSGLISGFSGDLMESSGFAFYSPQLSTDFLELPTTARERREYYRWFYRRDPIVGTAIDLHTEIPLSKLRLTLPPSRDRAKAERILKFYENMCSRMKLFRSLLEMAHEYWLLGGAWVFAEDSSPLGAVPPDDYQGWDRLIVLPPEMIKPRYYAFSDYLEVELIPDSDTRELVQRAHFDERARRIAEAMPEEIRRLISNGENLPLGTDPFAGSHVFHLARKKSQYETEGISILERVLPVLVYRDKLRQAQTQIASRNMSPKHLVWAEGISEEYTEELREHVDMAMHTPDYAIVTNFQVTWDMVGNQDRLLQLATEYDITDAQLMAGLGVTRELLTGEGTYSGNRISLEVMNTRYLLFREIVQDIVEENLFKPVAIRKGFVEKDDVGNDIILYPRLSFSRLSLKDNAEVFDALFNLYQKGSLSIDFILELFNIDPRDSRERIERDLWTVQDGNANELIRGVFGDAVGRITGETDVVDRIIENLGLVKKPEEGEDGDGAGGEAGGGTPLEELV